MTDRHSGYVVILAQDIREDDAESIVQALRMVKGVLSVEPIIASPSAELTADHRARIRVHDQLIDMAQEILNGSSVLNG